MTLLTQREAAMALRFRMAILEVEIAHRITEGGSATCESI